MTFATSVHRWLFGWRRVAAVPAFSSVRDTAFRHWKEERVALERGLPTDATRGERAIFAGWQTKHRLAGQRIKWRKHASAFWREYEGGDYAAREKKARDELAALIVWTPQPEEGKEL